MADVRLASHHDQTHRRRFGARARELSRLGPGEYVGEIALLQNSPRTATITASVDSTLLSLQAQYFHEFIMDFMQLGQALSRASSRRLSLP